MDTLIFNIDSRLTDMSGYAEFKYDLNKNGSGTIKNATEIKISSFEFPNTSHFFNSNYDNISFKVDTTTISINPGNYNTDDLITSINTAFSTNSINIIASINKNTGKITFSLSNSYSFDFSNTTNYDSLGKYLGFSQNLYTNVDAGEFTAENIPNVVGENYFFLRVNNYGNVENNGRKYLSKMIMVAPKYEMNFESRSRYVTKTFKFNEPTDITVLNVSVHDYLNNKVNLNGVNFSFTLEVTVVNNKVLKNYHQVSMYSKDLLEVILHDHMLEFYTRENKKHKEDKVFDNTRVGNPLLSNMNNVFQESQKSLQSRDNFKKSDDDDLYFNI